MILCLDRTDHTAKLTDRDGFIRGEIGVERFGSIHLYYWRYYTPWNMSPFPVSRVSRGGHLDTMDEAIEVIERYAA